MATPLLQLRRISLDGDDPRDVPNFLFEFIWPGCMAYNLHRRDLLVKPRGDPVGPRGEDEQGRDAAGQVLLRGLRHHAAVAGGRPPVPVARGPPPQPCLLRGGLPPQGGRPRRPLLVDVAHRAGHRPLLGGPLAARGGGAAPEGGGHLRHALPRLPPLPGAEVPRHQRHARRRVARRGGGILRAHRPRQLRRRGLALRRRAAARGAAREVHRVPLPLARPPRVPHALLLDDVVAPRELLVPPQLLRGDLHRLQHAPAAAGRGGDAVAVRAGGGGAARAAPRPPSCGALRVAPEGDARAQLLRLVLQKLRHRAIP
eukprot:CAMPEP_0118924666 /NCGR_PEP_ID=MMETSP1169-20130426/2697_1 /TAXON_ID=36882 /ORGANISM="Pyramimonas obovata, Strain CCMP722" /LENGTH=313 /DNA_ID=CAMNT_0006865797 /DNA_START=395 /DNA_END=1334 /DNA_ORIENTATION=+